MIPLDLSRMRRGVARLSEKRFRLLRVHPNDKRPVDPGWPEVATDHPSVLDEWFARTAFNLGVACGPQPNGINLVAIDVDSRHGGLDRWAALLEINGHPDTAMHSTPTGGLHVFFDAPFPVNNSGNLGAGIDVRGRGGQVVVPPSTRFVDDELLAYEAVSGRGLWEHAVEAMPDWLCDLLRPIERSVERHPSQPRPQRYPSDTVGNGEWLRDHWDWLDELERVGYEQVKQVGERVFLRHPTATSEWSCTVDPTEGRMCAYSTNMPGPWRERQINRDGSVSWSPLDWFVVVTYGGDASAATREINRRRGYVSAGEGRPGRAAGAAPDQDRGHRLPVVSSEYWEASARNRHIFTAARAAMVSPDALDLVVFALESLLIPPGYLLPRIVGGQQPLNMLTCLVAPTGLFKTATLDAARDLMGPLPPWVEAIGMGSGEGIGAMFLKEETEDNAKGTGKVKTGRMVRNDVKGVFFEADEGSGLTEQAGRAGATVIANLCKAWSGSTLGEANADLAKRRRVVDRDYRVAALVNIQPSNFAGLFSLANTGTGLTGRFMFSGTADYDIPDTDTDWPGTLEHPKFPDMPVTLTIAPSIISRAKASIRERHRSATLDTGVDAVGQNAAVVGRMAAIAVLVDGRSCITEDDWAVAQLRAATSAGCLAILSEWGEQKRRDRRHSEDLAKADSIDTIESVRDLKAKGRLAEAIRRKVEDGPMGRNKLAKATTSSETRGRFDGALDLAVANGWITVVEGRVEKA